MVMEVTPSPQCVGREFVRQYYTLLNEGPEFLHRFYSHNSSYHHCGDGVDQGPVIGQSEIHKKIMSLNFHDCHAKIRYVDSQSTMATGVVVMVTGELSNNQQPLRRFMQTFVLAPQTPNKYYVHNDIFRYQDEVFNDSDEEDGVAEVEQNVSNQQPIPKQPTPPEPTDHAIIEASQPMHFYQQHQMQAPMEQHQHNGRPTATTPPAPAPEMAHNTPEPVLTNGHQEEPINQRLPTPPTVPGEPVGPPQHPTAYAPVETEADPTPAPDTAAPIETSQQDPPAETVPVPADDKPRSWANLLNHQTGPSSANTNGHPPLAADSSPSSSGSPDKPAAPQPQRPPQTIRNNRPGNSITTDSKGFGGHRVSRPARAEEGYGGEDRKPDRHKYPDAQQVFVGNLPPTISDFELRDYFKQHGTVLEVRVNRTSTVKLPFGFVVFADESSAQKVLANKSMDYNGQRLNIEEKKPRNESRTHSNPRNNGRRDGPRHPRGGGNRRGMGGGGMRDEGDNRNEHGRFNNLNKAQNRR